MRDRSLSAWLPDFLQFRNGHVIDPRVLRIYNYSKRVESNRQLNVFNAVGPGLGHLLGKNRARSICDVYLTSHELLEAPAGTRNSDRNVYLALLFPLKLLCHGLRDWKDGARSVNLDYSSVARSRRRISRF